MAIQTLLPTVVTASGGAPTWTSASGILLVDATGCVVKTADTNTSQTLILSNFGFALDSTSTVNTIQVNVIAATTSTGVAGTGNLGSSLLLGASAGIAGQTNFVNNNAPIAYSSGNVNYVAQSWQLSTSGVTTALVNSTGFCLNLIVQNLAGGGYFSYFDNASLTLDFTTPYGLYSTTSLSRCGAFSIKR